MKKLIVIVLTILFFGVPVFAEDVTFTDKGDYTDFKKEDFIPDIVTDTLKESKIDPDSPENVKSVLGFVLQSFKSIFANYSSHVGILLGIILFVSVFYKFIDNKCFKTITSYIITLVLLTEIFLMIKKLIFSAYDTLNAISEILSAVLPAFTGILLIGGSTFTSLTESASFGAVLTLLHYVIKNLILPFSGLLMLLLMFERLSPQLSEMNLLRFFKKNVLTVLSFITMIMLTVISYQHIVSAGKDSISGRTVKFAASNFIPIVGAAVGESFKTISAGLKYLKNTVGTAVMLSITVTVLPVIIEIFLCRIYLNFLSFTAGITGCKGEQGVIESSVSILDFFNAIIICATVLSLLLVIVFILSVFSVGV